MIFALRVLGSQVLEFHDRLQDTRALTEGSVSCPLLRGGGRCGSNVSRRIGAVWEVARVMCANLLVFHAVLHKLLVVHAAVCAGLR